jgi:hypothetical protein
MVAMVQVLGGGREAMSVQNIVDAINVPNGNVTNQTDVREALQKLADEDKTKMSSNGSVRLTGRA